MRWAAVVLCFAFPCKKEKAPEPTPEPTTPSVGYSRTVLHDDAAVGSTHAPHDAGEEPDAQLYGGNGQAAYRDEQGHLHGPGGPIYMGRGPDCTDKIDHCLREGVWFAVGNVVRGKLYRATPVFQFEGKWWTFREKEEDDYYALYRTKVVEHASELTRGSPVIWLIEENSSPKWVNSEHDALTSSRWEAGVIESVGTTTFKVYGWPSAIPLDTARKIVQQKKP